MRAVRRRLDASSLMAQKSPPFVILNRYAVQGHLRLGIDYEDMPLATSWGYNVSRDHTLCGRACLYA